MRNAKIVCTLGPASSDAQTISELVDAGMSVARMNASHGSPDDRRELVDRLRAVDADHDESLAVMLDLPGPEVRTAPMEGSIHLATGSEVRFFPGETASPDAVGLSEDISAVSEGDIVLIDDGRIETTVTRVEGTDVFARVDSGGDLTSRKGVNVPGVDLGLDIITDDDMAELRVAADKEVDFVAASFVASAADVYTIRDTLEELGADIPVIAKIERADAVDNLAGIVDAAYGVMVARGDLGVECPLEQVPLIQKRIIRTCRESGTPVITATEMLDSMVHARRPTRAEATDVANAVLDGTDAVMLSGETAIGDHPVRVVETMARIIHDVEASNEYHESLEQRVPTAGETQTDALARSARFLARDVDASAVIAASESGYTALKAAKYRPTMPVIATTPTDAVRRKLVLSWGIVPRQVEFVTDGTDTLIHTSVQAAIDADVAHSGDTVVVLSGMMTEFEGTDTTNMLKVHVAAEIIATGRSIVDGRIAAPVYQAPDGDLSDVPAGSLVALPDEFDGELTGDLSTVAGFIDAHEGMTGYAAIVARELGVPMISGASLPTRLADGAVVTLDAERGVVYEGDVVRDRTGERDRS